MRILHVLVIFLFVLSCVQLETSAFRRKKFKKLFSLDANLFSEAVTSNGNTLYASYTDGLGSNASSGIMSFRKKSQAPVMMPVEDSGTLLGLFYRSTHKDILVTDPFFSRILSFNPETQESTVFSDLSSLSPGFLNDVIADSEGSAYVTDSSNSVIYKIDEDGSNPIVWAENTLFAPNPSFGCNGLAFNTNETAMFVANTERGTLLKVEVLDDFEAGEVSILAQDILGADGVSVDTDHDLIYVAANRAPSVYIFHQSGTIAGVVGDYEGVTNGSPNSMFTPTSVQVIENAVVVVDPLFSLAGSFSSLERDQITVGGTVWRVRFNPEKAYRD